MAAMHGEDDPWARKIRGTVEQSVWKDKDICRIPHMRQALYYRPADGDPMLGEERMTAKQIVSGLFVRKVPWEPVSALLVAVFDFLSDHAARCRALSIAEMTRIVSIYHGALYRSEFDALQEDTQTSLADEEQRFVDSAVQFLIDGRLGYYLQKGIYTEEECETIESMARGYLEDLLCRKILPLRDYVHAAFPGDDARSVDLSELKRISNLLIIVRSYVKSY